MNSLIWSAFCLLLVTYSSAGPASQCRAPMVAFTALPGLRYPQCDAPEYIRRPQDSPAVDSDITSTVQEAQFLSFEDWKARNLAIEVAAEQNQAHHNEEASRGARVSPLARSISTSSSSDEPDTQYVVKTAHATNEAKSVETVQTRSGYETDETQRDIRISAKKERFNHASFDCAASIVQANRESKGSSNILKENKDYYMLNTCGAANKFVVIELCNDILVDSIQLANYEYFSGVFKEVKVHVAAKYPPGREGWQELGNFRARNVRDIQTFQIENPLIWTRYVKVDMLSFYGSEFYCPLSLVRIFGKTMMEDYKQEGNQDIELSTESGSSSMIEQSSEESVDESERLPNGLAALSGQLAHKLMQSEREPAVTVEVDIQTAETSTVSAPVSATADSPTASTSGSLCSPEATLASLTHSLDTEMSSTSAINPASTTSAQRIPVESQSIPAAEVTVYPEAQAYLRNDTSESGKQHSSSNGSVHRNASESKHPMPKPSSPHPSPSTQESIYKQIAKRLSLLEANATLSLKYIESQSSLLAQSFSQLSNTQARHLANFLENVNVTMLQRMALLTKEYEQLYLDAMSSVDAARHRQEQDSASSFRKLGTLSDDIRFFKRLGIFQSLLMIILLGFLVTSRGAGIEIHSHLNRALSRREFSSGSPIRSPGSSWRNHFRSISMAGSAYSFPVGQIERPDRSSTPNTTDGREFGHGNGLGIDGLYADDPVPNSEPVVRVRSPLVHQQSFRSKDDMYDGDLNSSIRRRLYRNASWSSTKEDTEMREGQRLDRPEVTTGEEDYPTPRTDSDDDDE